MATVVMFNIVIILWSLFLHLKDVDIFKMYKLTVVLQSSVLHYTLPALEIHWELFSCLALIPASNI